ncbi:MAG: adenine phosphoribosyltransferase, partial [Limisphaerales bacterium]
AAAAAMLNAGFVPIRKQGKLPFETIEQSYDLEYGSNTIAMHRDAVLPGQRVLLLDDLLATGGTAAAALELLQQLQAQVVEAVFLVELEFLSGRKLLGDVPVRSIIAY